jgi:hypothetical protein
MGLGNGMEKAGICRNSKSRIVVRLHTETLAEIRTVRTELFGEIGRTHAQAITQLERFTNRPIFNISSKVSGNKMDWNSQSRARPREAPVP